jgi:hypothetical protein
MVVGRYANQAGVSSDVRCRKFLEKALKQYLTILLRRIKYVCELNYVIFDTYSNKR